MPIKSTRTLTRPNKSVAFWQSGDDWKSYVKTTYQDTGLQQSLTVTHSTDKLTATVTTIWKDRAAFDAYNADPNVQTMFLNPRAEYSAANNISISDYRVELA